MKWFVLAFTLALTVPADARVYHRLYINPLTWGPAETAIPHPLYYFSQHICAFVTLSVPPDLDPFYERLYLGKCPSRNQIIRPVVY